MRPRKILVLPSLAGLALSCALCCMPSAPAQAPQKEPDAFLIKHIQCTPADLSTLEKGEPVAKMLQTRHPLEVPPFGIVKVRAAKEYFLEKYRDIATFKKAKEVLQIGKFHLPPRLEDLDGLTLEPRELEDLRKCRPGDCTLKLSEAMINRLQKEIDWKAPDHASRTMALYRRMLLEYLTLYLADGNTAMITYRDKQNPVRLADEFRSLMENSPYLKEYTPEFKEYLEAFPKARLQNAEHLIYWSKESFGFKSVVSITHTVIYNLSPQAAVIGAKQIYASHYFVGSIGLAAFLEKSRNPAQPEAYLMYLNRTRVDLIQGLFSGVLRFFVKRRVLDGLNKYLGLVKTRLESGYRMEAQPQRP